MCLGWIFPTSDFCRAGYVVRYCFKLTVSWKVLLYPSMVIERFAWFISLAWHLWSLRDWRTSVPDLLAFVLFIEKLGGMFYVTSSFFPFVALLHMFSVLIIMWNRDIFSDPINLLFCKLTFMGMFFFR